MGGRRNSTRCDNTGKTRTGPVQSFKLPFIFVAAIVASLALVVSCGPSGGSGSPDTIDDTDADAGVDVHNDTGCAPGRDSGPDCEDTACTDGGDCGHGELPRDTTPPRISVESPMQSPRQPYVLLGRVNDESEVPRIEVQLNGGEFQPPERAGDRFRTVLELERGENDLVIRAEDGSGNRGMTTLTIFYDPNPDLFRANFAASGRLRVGSPVVFDASSTAVPRGENADYRWDFGDGTSARGKKVVHFFGSASTHIVRLDVTTDSDQTTSHLDNIAIDPATTQGEASLDLQMKVVDQNDAPIADARVSIPAEEQAAQTDKFGRATLSSLSQAGTLAVTATKDGFSRDSTRLETDSGNREAYLVLRLEASSATKEQQGPKIDHSEGEASLAVAMNDLRTPDGRVVTGPVRVRVEALSPGQVARLSSEGVLRDGSRAHLTSVGGIHVEILKNGQRVTLARGASAQVSIPLSEAPTGSSSRVWRLAKSYATWVPGHRGKVVERGGTPVFELDVSELGYWMAGRPVKTTFRLDVSCGLPAAQLPSSKKNDFSGSCSVALERKKKGWSRLITMKAGKPRQLKVPTGEICAHAVARGGLCEATDCLAGRGGDQKQLQLGLECHDAGAPTLTPDKERTGEKLQKNSTDVFRVQGETGQGMILELAQTDGRRLEGRVELRTVDGTLVKSQKFNGGDATVGHIFSTDRTLLAEVTGTKHTPAEYKLEARLTRTLRIPGTATLPINSKNKGETLEVLFEPSKTQAVNTLLHTKGGIDIGYHALTVRALQTDRQLASTRWGERETGLFEISGREMHLLQIKRNSVGDRFVSEFDVSVAAIGQQPKSLNFSQKGGRAVVRGKLETLGGRKFYQFQAKSGDGIVATLRARGATADERLSKAAIRIRKKTSNAPFWQLRGRNRFGKKRVESDYGFPNALHSVARRLRSKGTYIIEVHNYRHDDPPTNLGAFELQVDRVRSAKTITVDDTLACKGADTRSPVAAAYAVQKEGTVDLCEGVYRSHHPLFLGPDGVSVRGAGKQKSTFRYSAPASRGGTNGGYGAVLIGGDKQTLRDLTVIADEDVDGGRVNSVVTNSRPRWLPGPNGTGWTLENLKIDSSIPAGLPAREGHHPTAVGLEQPNLPDRGIVKNVVSTHGEWNLKGPRHELTSVAVKNPPESRQPPVSFEVANQIALRNSTIEGAKGRCLSVEIVGRGQTAVKVENNTCTGGTLRAFDFKIANSKPGTVRIARNRFNSIRVRGYRSDARVEFARNRVSLNRTNEFFGWGGQLSIKNNVFADTQSRFGNPLKIHLQALSKVEILNNSFETHGGSAIHFKTMRGVSGPLPVTLTNNVFSAGKKSVRDPAIRLWTARASGTVTTSHNAFHHFGSSFGKRLTASSSKNRVTKAPDFQNSALEIKPTSPLVDAGTCMGAPKVDFKGLSRPKGQTCDIGAYER